MKLGLITDIHEHVVTLRRALEHLAELRVDKIVMIGDVVEMGRRLEGTCQLLAEAQVVGVWGNHDFGLCSEPEASVFSHISPQVRAYMGTLQPRLVVEECHFSHVEPWLDPTKLEDLWHFEGKPSEHGDFSRIFAATPHRLMFAGHYHAWQVVTPERVLDWHGEAPISLAPGRYFVTVGALCEGDYGVLDTETSVLTPLKVASA
jgi:predicted phosphodiesterase